MDTEEKQNSRDQWAVSWDIPFFFSDFSENSIFVLDEIYSLKILINFALQQDFKTAYVF